MEVVTLTPALVIDLLLLMLAANGAPILFTRILGDRWAWPVDGGLRLWDGRPLFGASKTWRGIVVGFVVCALMAELLGYGFTFGLIFGSAKWIHFSRLGIPAPTGTVMLATVTVILGVQLLLSAIGVDLQAVPKDPVCAPLSPVNS